MKKRISVPQLVIGVILGFFIVLGVIAGTGYLYFMKLSSTPPKPDYPELSEAEKQKAKALTSGVSPTAGGADETYVALVLIEGLIMRADPEQSAEVVLTLKEDETVRVLGRSPDDQWQEVLLETTGDRGWVSKGNTKRVN